MKKTNLTKALFIAAFAIVAALTGCSSDGQKLNVEMLPVQLAKDGNWSMLKPDGSIMYEGEFKEAPTMAVNGMFTVKEGEGYTVYKTGDKPVAVKNMEDLKEVGIMAGGLIPAVAKNSRIALYDDEGNKKFELMPHKGREIVECAPFYCEGLLYVADETGMVGFVDNEGKMVIEPQYDRASGFTEGYAVVYKKQGADNGKTDNENYKKSVINKKGETVLDIKDGYELSTPVVIAGYLSVKDENDRYLFIDMKGETIKCPAKVEEVAYWTKDFYVFRSDGSYGVMDYKGETLIRPKYDEIVWDNDHEIFFAKMSDECMILDKKGEKVKNIDYEYAYPIMGYGIVARDKRTYALIDKEGKQIGKDDCHDMILSISGRHLETDYFDAEAIIRKLVEKISDKGYGSVKFGANPSDYLKEHVYNNTAEVPDMTEKGFRYSVDVGIGSSVNFAQWQDGEWQWNPESKVQFIITSLKVQGEWEQKQDESLVKAIGRKGFKELGHKLDDSNYTALLQKGNTYILYRSELKAIVMFDGNVPAVKAQMQQLATELGTAAMPAEGAEPDGGAVDGQTDNPFAWLAQREATNADIQGKSKAELRIMRNAIYAQKGMKFKSKDLQEYFGRYAWYSPLYDDVTSQLTAIEKKNAQFLKSHE